MRLRSVALFAIALACAPPAAPGVVGVQKATSLRLPQGVTLEAEALDLVVDPRLSSFSGTATLRVGLATASPSIVLHGRDLEISRATVRDASGERSAKVSTRHAFGGREADEELVLAVEPPLAAGSATIALDYRAPFAKLRGLYRVEIDGEWFAFTQLEAVDARRMFPSFDEPRFKAPFTVRVTVPNGMTAFGNGALERTVPSESGDHVRFEFATTPPLPSYLVALAVGRLEAIALAPSGSTPIRLIATPGRAERGRAALAEAEGDLRVLGEYFGRTYPYGKLDLVAVPDFGPGAMENAGLVTFREELLLADHAPLATRRRRSIVLAHELAHQWFGDWVTMRWWDDLWLNEAFATWMAAKTCDAQNPAFGGALDLVAGKLGAMTADALPSARSVRQPVETSDAIQEAGGWSAYQKGAAVLAMIERWIGRETFRDGIRAYVAAHPHGTVVAADLLGALDRASGKPVTEVATPLLERTGVPIVRATTTCTDGTLTASATLERPGAFGAWPAPICASQAGTTKCALVPASSSNATLQFPTCAAIYGNADEAGYYRFVGVGSALRPGSEAERLAVLPNAWAQVLAGALDGAGFFDTVVAANLESERSRFVLEQAVGALGAAMDALVADDAAGEMFRRWVRRWLRPRAAELGPASRPGEADDDRLLRATLWAALWDLGRDPDVARAAEPLAEQWLHGAASADPELGPLAVRISAASGGLATHERLTSALTKATGFERAVLIGALASSTSHLDEVFEMIVTGVIHPSEVRYVWGAVGRTPAGRAKAAAFFRERFEDLRVALGGVSGLAGSIGWACDEASQRQGTSFFAPKLESFDAMQRAYDEGLEASRSCIATRGKAGPSATAWLAAHPTP